MNNKNLRRKFLVPLFIAGALVGLIGSWFTYETALTHLRDEFVGRGQLLAGAIVGLANATEGGFQSSVADLRLAVEEFDKLEPSVLSIVVATKDPFIILVSTVHAGIDTDETLAKSLASIRDAIDGGRFGHRFDSNDHLTLLLPLRPKNLEIGKVLVPKAVSRRTDGGTDLRYSPLDYRGAVLLRLDWAKVRQASTAILWHSVIVTLMGIAGVLLVAYILLQTIVLRPMGELQTTIARQKEEGHSAARVPALANDEIGVVARALNEMLDSIEERDRRLQQSHDELETRVRERTEELRIAHAEIIRQERLAALGQVSATVGHELRNPLGVIRNCIYSITLKTRGVDLGIAESIDLVAQNIDRCDRIIASLLDYTREKRLEKVVTRIDDWLGLALDNLTSPEGSMVRRELCSDAELAFDREHMHQVVVNLFDNACQAAPGNGNKVTSNANHVITVATATEEARVIVSFADTGAGISAANLGKIFEPLYSTKAFGAGLGLPLVRNILEQHGGGIEIDSTEGQGTLVTLWLPLTEKA